jgi:para-nitrobenzyl esterase
MQDDTLVETELGRLRGVRHQGAIQFRGVPYALPPVGERRFRPPTPHPSWTGERGATRHGPIAPQLPSRLRTVMGTPEPLPQGEDCLTLTISTPGSGAGLRPVVVWLHGGAYLTGAGSLAWYDGARLAHEGDLVVVGVNYRLGALGYLCRPGLGEGTAGVEDVLGALRWVQANAPAFGGDPDRVTLMGQSAGGGMICYLLARGHAPHLFRRAILQSAHLGRPPFSRTRGEERTARLVALLGLGAEDAGDVNARLREVPVSTLLEKTAALAGEVARPGDTSPPLLPVLDELSTEDTFVEGAAAGAKAVELLIGTTRDEMKAWLGTQTFPTDGPDLAPATAAAFGAPSVRLAASVPTAWVYRFDWSPAGSPAGACHCIELPFVFGTWEAWTGAQMLAGSDPAEVTALTRRLQSAWIAFAHTGDPSAGGSPWPAYRPGGGLTRHFTGGPEVVRDVREGVPA